jgi:hypothetical protein
MAEFIQAMFPVGFKGSLLHMRRRREIEKLDGSSS